MPWTSKNSFQSISRSRSFFFMNFLQMTGPSYVVACVEMSFIFMVEWYSMTWMCFVLLILLSIDNFWIISTFLLLCAVLLWTFMYKYLNMCLQFFGV
jgi:hypothetical protein